MPTTEKTADPTAAWLQERIAFEGQPENAISVPAELVKPHPLVKAAVAVVRAQVAGLQRNREWKERPHDSGERPRLDLGNPSWHKYLERGFIELAPEILPMRVSIPSAERALRLWNAVLVACKARGLRASVEGLRARISDGTDYVELRLAEKIDQNKRLVMVGRMHTFARQPTGLLRLFIDKTKLEETAERPLEQQLNGAMVEIYRTIAMQRTRRIAAIERERRREAEAQVQAQARATAAEAAQLRDEELQRKQAEQNVAAERERVLVAEVGAWRDAVAIRAYAAHIAASIEASGAATPAVRDWLTWAESVAGRIDPTVKRLAQ